LIDFPFYQESGHALQDLALLETVIKFALLDRQADSSPTELLAFDYTCSQVELWRLMEDHLLSADWLTEKTDWITSAYQRNVKQSIRLISRIRSTAMDVQKQHLSGNDPSFFDEYLAALLYHTIREIGNPSRSIFKRLFAVYSAGSILRLLNSMG